MKALLIAAALAVPIAARADDPNKDMGSSKTTTPSTTTVKDESFSEAKVLNKIHHVNKKHVELGQLVRTRGGTDKIRTFGAKLVKDHQKLDKDVISYAKNKNITLDEAYTEMSSAMPSMGGNSPSMGTSEPGSKNEQAGTGATASGDINAQGTAPGGTANEPPSGTVATSPSTGASGNPDRYGSTGSQAGSSSNYPQQKPGSTDTTARAESTGTSKDQWSEKLEELKSLQGSEFDTRFLSTVVDNADQAITRLQGFKGQGDKKLDKLIDSSVKLLQDHRDEAQKLQQRTPAA